jgi:hypothetical protein
VEYWSGEYDKYSGEVRRFKESDQEQIQIKAEQRRRGWR